MHDLARVRELAEGEVDPAAFRSMEVAAEADEFFDSETLVACRADQVVGFVSWSGSYITWLYVDPACHHQGIGSRLLREALDRIGPEAWTSMLSKNEPALQLYLKAGMEVVWSRAGTCEGFPCEAMRLALPTSRMRDPEARRNEPETPA